MSERQTHWDMLAMFPATVAVPVVTALFGIGIIRLKSNPIESLVGPTLMVGGISFLIAQGTETDWGLTYFYPLFENLLDTRLWINRHDLYKFR